MSGSRFVIYLAEARGILIHSAGKVTRPPLGYVIELKPLGNFSRQKAEQLREELVKQLGIILYTKPKAWVEASVFVGDKKEIPASCLYKPRNRYWAGGS